MYLSGISIDVIFC